MSNKSGNPNPNNYPIPEDGELLPAGTDYTTNSDWFVADTTGSYYHGMNLKNGFDELNAKIAEIENLDAGPLIKTELWDDATKYTEMTHGIIVFDFDWQIFNAVWNSWKGSAGKRAYLA